MPSTDATPAYPARGRRPGPRKAISRRLTVVTYTGQRSGTTFSIPVGNRRAGDVARIGVRFPDTKGWWRNFPGDGTPLTVQPDAVDRPRHGLAHRDAKDRETVTVRL
ncbi:hypothetical protein ACL02O_32500 [Micromonospora sp. MS34]|uniref:hypothetical protein n=1 Tax=Micromonospora sp. MS34 TaxID=3385971 RepID=UPI0039A0D477